MNFGDSDISVLSLMGADNKLNSPFVTSDVGKYAFSESKKMTSI